MGRTNPTYRDYLRRFEEDWEQYRRALRREYQQDFDRLPERADQFAAAAGHQNSSSPFRAIVMSMLLAQEIDQRQLPERVLEEFPCPVPMVD